MTTNNHKLKAAYLLGFFHRAILPGVRLLFGDLGMFTEGHTEIIKGISPLKVGIKQLLPMKEANRLIKKLDSIYIFVTKLKIGKLKDGEGDKIYSQIEDLCEEIKGAIYEFAEAFLKGRSYALFKSGEMLSIWNDMSNPPYKLPKAGMDILSDSLKSAKLFNAEKRAKELYKIADDDFWRAHSSVWLLHCDILDLLNKEILNETKDSEPEAQSLNKLTGLPDLVQFNADVVGIFEVAETPFSIAFIDMDNLKALNTEVGHVSADEVIKQLALLLKSALKDRASTYHRSGDEFLAIFLNTTSEEAQALMRRIVDQVRTKKFSIPQKFVDITISVGIASYPEHDPDIQKVIKHANAAMYASKNGGKSCSTIWNTTLKAS
jgi:diguanylate cyclase (GGDEF)-like protein